MKQLGRSMIEMLAVLAVIGVLSIGGIALYRRAVNNHHANTILDDVNRFAFAIIEKGNYPLGEDLPKGDFKESGIYTLTAHQAAGANQFSILVSNVPKGVCEPLVDKANIDYKVGVVTAGGSVDDEIIYDTLNKDICNNDINDVVFYFGDTSLVCNPKEDGYTPCTTNADCCGGEFCWFSNSSACPDAGIGQCKKITQTNYPFETEKMSDGHIWTRSKNTMNWWSAQNWCAALGLRPVSRSDLGCSNVGGSTECTKSSILAAIQNNNAWRNADNTAAHWLEEVAGQACAAYFISFSNRVISGDWLYDRYYRYALCH